MYICIVKLKNKIMEALKKSFYQVAKTIFSKELLISNIGVQKEFEKFCTHLEPIMTHPRILNQFKLSCEKWQEETGIQTTGHFESISKFIAAQPKNY